MTEHLDRHPNPTLDAHEDPSSPCDGVPDASPQPRAASARPRPLEAPSERSTSLPSPFGRSLDPAAPTERHPEAAAPPERHPAASPDASLGASYVRVETVAFRRAFDEARARTTQRRDRLAERKPATVARRLALAHRLDADIQAGVYEDQADVARQHGLTRARLTQLMNLLLLAPDIQEELLALEVPAGREPISERALRPLTETLLWSEQRTLWRGIRTEDNGRHQPQPGDLTFPSARETSSSS